MAKIITRYENEYVYFWSAETKQPAKALCLGLTKEAGEWAYILLYEDNLEEIVFIKNVLRIVLAKDIEDRAEVETKNPPIEMYN